MANDFYTPSGNPATNAQGSSATIRAEFALIEDGFDLNPTVTGNGDLPIFVNSGGTSLEAISAASARTKLAAEGTANKDASGGYVGLTVYDINFTNAAGTFESYFKNTNTASRDYTFQDRDGTIADDTDLALKANLASPALTGTPTAPTAASGTSTTQIATCEFVQAEASATNPNLLINPNFVDNQEGYDADGVATLASGEYGHDMYSSIYGTIIYTKETDGDITIDSILNTIGSTQLVGIVQENDDLYAAVGEEVTLSLYCVSITSDVNLTSPGLSTQTITSPGWYSYTYTLGASPYIRIGKSLGAAASATPAFRFNSLKIERGGARTKWVVPESVAESNRCYYYYCRLSGAGVVAGNGVAISSSSNISIPTPVKMKSTVSVSVSAYSHWPIYSEGGAYSVPTALSVAAVNPGAVQIQATISTVGTSVLPSAMYSGSSSSVLELDARY